MRADQFEYELPPELIAQTPTPRGESRLLVLRRDSGDIEHKSFSDLPEYLTQGDTVVLNDTRVSARRLVGVSESGRVVEVLLLRTKGEQEWEALGRPASGLKTGAVLKLLGPPGRGQDESATVMRHTEEGGRVLRFRSEAARNSVSNWGCAPLPPYVKTALPADQEQQYQTIYAAHNGSAAAPTAGLHFTREMLGRIAARGVRTATITLHVGTGTFRPIRSETLTGHTMHSEEFVLDSAAESAINRTSGRIVAVGTTTVRALETSAAMAAGGAFGGRRVMPYAGSTQLFIQPGHQFRAVDALITNFHMPRSTLLVLISAFAGRDAVIRAYREAIELGYRFYSFGDAMLII